MKRSKKKARKLRTRIREWETLKDNKGYRKPGSNK